MRRTTKLCALLLASLMVTGLVAACDDDAGNGGGGSGATAGLSDVTLWGMPGPEKVYQDIGKDNEIYAAYKTEAKVDLTMAKGEKEGAHVIISADKKAEYNVTGAALTSGANTIAAENVEIFVEKYTNVAAITDGRTRGLPIAKYPDAIVPMANIKKVGENIIEEGNNQGIYVRVNVPVDQAAGVYTGNITVTVGTESTSVPVSVNVLDVAVPAENHARSLFTVGWSWYKGELDTSQEMLDKYYAALLEYRINPGFIIDTQKVQNFNESMLGDFVDKAYAYMQNPMCNTVALPFRQAGGDLDTGLMTATLEALLAKSEAEDYDMFAKSIYYLTFIDEPQDLGIVAKAKQVCQTYQSALQAFAAQHTASKFYESIVKLPNVLTNQYNSEFDGTGVVYCPKYNYYDTAEQRDQYGDLTERWWYGCVVPSAPYPTYHTDDLWLSQRLVGWMQAEYDVVGNLFWATDMYASYDNHAGYQEIEEYYEGNAARYGDTNGDGYLFYPGKQYGINGPVGSLRLESIRDGLEEYELLAALKANYNKVSGEVDGTHAPDFRSLMTSLSEKLYGGTKVSATTAEFAQSRSELMTMSVINAACDFSVVGYEDDGHGNIKYSFVAADGVTVKNHGAALSGTAAGTGYKYYEVEVQLVNASNTIALTFEKGDKTYSYTLNCGGALIEKQGSALNPADFAEKASEPTAEVVGTEMKVSLPAVTEGTEQSFVMQGSNIADVNSDTSKVILHIRYEGTDNPELTLMVRYTNSMAYTALVKVALHQGDNEITLDFMNVDWSRNGALTRLGFAFYGEEGATIAAKTLYISEMIVYKK